MAKYSFKFKLKIVQNYLEGKGGLSYLSKKYGVKSKKQVEDWLNAYHEFGEEGVLRKRQNQSYPVQFKMDAIELYQSTELSYREVANYLGINNPALITNWMRIFRAEGLDWLSKTKGCPSILTKKKETEVQLLRLLSNTPLQINVEFIYPSSHQVKNTAQTHLNSFYSCYHEIKENFYDGLIITGAPIEQLDFESVDYWGELQQIFHWSKSHIFSCFHICWGAEAGLYHDYQINKHPLMKKLSGIYHHKVVKKGHCMLRGFDDSFNAPHSRYAGIKKSAITKQSKLNILVESEEAGVFLISDQENRNYYMTGIRSNRNTIERG